MIIARAVAACFVAEAIEVVVGKTLVVGGFNAIGDIGDVVDGVIAVVIF